MELISSHQRGYFAASADGSRSLGSLWRLGARARFSIGFGSKLLSCTQQRVLLLIPAYTQRACVRRKQVLRSNAGGGYVQGRNTHRH